MRFSVTIDRDADGVWIAESPVFPGAVNLGSTKSAAVKNIKALLAHCFAATEPGSVRPARQPRHRFASEALIGSFATGLKTGDNATIRRLARERLREKNR